MGNTAKVDARRLHAAERRKRAAELRAEGMTYQQISDELGYSAAGNVCRDLKEHMANLPKASLEELRTTLDGKLQQAEARVWPLTKHADPNVRLRALDTFGKTIQRRADINGLKPPLVSVQLPAAAPDTSAALARLSPVELAILQYFSLAMASDERPPFETIRADVVEWLNEHSPRAIALLPEGRAPTGTPVRELAAVHADDDDDDL
jgi:hypothetical protein